jgi:hypothetical protein
MDSAPPLRLTAVQVEPDRQPQGRFTGRAVAIALLLAVAFGFIIPYVDVYLSDTFLGAQHLPPGAVFVLFLLLVVVNPLLGLLNQRWPLTRVELLVIYCTLLFSTLVPGHGAENVFIPVITTPYYYASPQNKWEELFFRYIPPWFAPQDRRVIVPLHEALPPGQPLPWHAWWIPLAVWGLHSAFLYGLVLALAVLFHRHWADGEKLSFPLVALPLEMTRDWVHPLRRGSFYRTPVMWAGFLLAVVLQTQAGLKFYFPAFPGFALSYDFTRLFREGPLRALGWVPGQVWPCVVGITVLLRSEVSFSMWFFYWFNHLQRLVAFLLGVRVFGEATTWGEPSWLGNQTVGAYTVYVVLAFWAARLHFARLWQRAVAGQTEPHLPFSYRTALLLLAACGAGILLWDLAAGLSAWVALSEVLVYVILAVALTKVVAESGMLFVQATYSWLEVLQGLVGTRAVGARNLTVGMFIERSFMTDLRAFLMPSFAHTFKIADLARVEHWPLLAALLPCILLATVLSYYMNLRLLYTYGAVNCNPWMAKWAGLGGFNLLADMLRNPRPPSPVAMGAMAAGALFTYWLTKMRQRFVWFPFHPMGYMMMQTYPMKCLWFSTLLGWTFKSLVLKYAGVRGLARVIPFFLGLAFGDFFAMVVWLAVDALTGKHGHYLMPG